MGILSRLGLRSEKRSGADPTLGELLARQRGGGYNFSGEAVTYVSALGVSTVFACVSIIADSIAGMPW